MDANDLQMEDMSVRPARPMPYVDVWNNDWTWIYFRLHGADGSVIYNGSCRGFTVIGSTFSADGLVFTNVVTVHGGRRLGGAYTVEDGELVRMDGNCAECTKADGEGCGCPIRGRWYSCIRFDRKDCRNCIHRMDCPDYDGSGCRCSEWRSA